MLYNEVTEIFEKTMKGRTQMYQLLDLKNMNLEEAVQLCKQEYTEEFKKSNMMPEMEGELEEYLTGFVGIAKKAPYGKVMVEGGKMIGFILELHVAIYLINKAMAKRC